MSGDGFDIEFQHHLRNTTWPFYAVGMSVIALRLYARIHRVGLRHLSPDDYIMVVAAGWYTILIVCLNVIATGGGSNLFPPEQLPTFTPEEIQERILGSKIVIVSEQGMLNVIYTLKACMLFMYARFMSGTTLERTVKWLSIYVACGWVATEIAFFSACQPFYGYWAVPPPNPQCTTLQHYAIVQACFNISSDLLILVIGLQMVHQLKLPMKQKLILGVVFSMGIFVIIAALLTKIFNLSDVYDTSYMLWYTREASVAVYVANLPMIWPLLREWFPFLRAVSQHPNYLPYSAHPSLHQRRASRNPFSSANGKSSQLKSDSDSTAPVTEWSRDKGGFDFDLEGLGADGRREGGQATEMPPRRSADTNGDIRKQVTVWIESEPPTPALPPVCSPWQQPGRRSEETIQVTMQQPDRKRAGTGGNAW